MSADQDTNTNDAVVAEARELGWVPKEDFRGDQSKWVDAEQFVEHGKHVMPILRKNNERLLDSQRATQRQVDQLTRELEAARNDFKTLEEFHNEEIVRRTQETRQQLLAQIKQAKHDGDVDTEVDLTDQLTQLSNAQREAEVEIRATETESPPAPLTPDYLDWQGRNTWFEKDPERTYLAMALAAAITKDSPHLRNRDFFAELDKRLAGSVNGAGGPRASKVEGSRGGGSNGANGGRSYADLPSDVKAACDKYAKKFVNPNGKFKTESEYRKHYVQQLEDQGYFN